MRLHSFVAVAAATTTLAFGVPSFAQPATQPDPFAVQSAPPARYESAFADYVPYREVAAGAWRKQNDVVRDAGGGHQHHGQSEPFDAANSDRRAQDSPTESNGTGEHSGHHGH